MPKPDVTTGTVGVGLAEEPPDATPGKPGNPPDVPAVDEPLAAALAPDPPVDVAPAPLPVDVDASRVPPFADAGALPCPLPRAELALGWYTAIRPKSASNTTAATTHTTR